MHKSKTTVLVLFLIVTCAWSQTTTSAKSKAILTEIHCMGCAKKIAKKLYQVPGVAEVRVDLDARTMFISHKPGLSPSPKLLWEAIESADHQIERLVTPTAKHVTKPIQ